MKKLVLVLALVGISINTALGSVNDTILKYKGIALTEDFKKSITSGVLEVINLNYPEIKEFTGFDLPIGNYIAEKVTGETQVAKGDLPDMYISISFDNSPNVDMIKKLVQLSINNLKKSGYPINPDRFLTKFIEREGRVFLVLALDETHIYNK